MPDIYNVNEENEYSKEEKYFEYLKTMKRSSLYAIAKERNLNPNLLAIMNGLETTTLVDQDQTLMLPKKGYSYYITKTGDTLESVRKIFDITHQKLISVNPIIYLHEGQLIVSKER